MEGSRKKKAFMMAEQKAAIKKKNGEFCTYCGCTNKLILTVDHLNLEFYLLLDDVNRTYAFESMRLITMFLL
jgi:hypothetical protein